MTRARTIGGAERTFDVLMSMDSHDRFATTCITLLNGVDNAFIYALLFAWLIVVMQSQGS